MPHQKRLTGIIVEALDSTGLGGRYAVDVYRLYDLHERRVTLTPTAPDGAVLELRFTIGEDPDWLGTANEARQQVQSAVARAQ